jgi:hypothetical protein
MITIKAGGADDIRIVTSELDSVATMQVREQTGRMKHALLVGFLSALAILSMPTEGDAHLFGVLHAFTDALAGTIHLPDLRLPEMNNILFHEPDNFL